MRSKCKMRLKCKNVEDGIYHRLGCLETNYIGSSGYTSWQSGFKVGEYYLNWKG